MIIEEEEGEKGKVLKEGEKQGRKEGGKRRHTGREELR